MKLLKIGLVSILSCAAPLMAYQKICKPIEEKIINEELQKDHHLAYSFLMPADKSPDRVTRRCSVYLTQFEIESVKKNIGQYSSDDEITLEMIQKQNPETVTGKILADYRGFEVAPGVKTVTPVYQMISRFKVN